jgi:hypothetical protein
MQTRERASINSHTRAHIPYLYSYIMLNNFIQLMYNFRVIEKNIKHYKDN